MRAKRPKYKRHGLRDKHQLHLMLDVGVVIETAGSNIAGHLKDGWSR